MEDLAQRLNQLRDQVAVRRQAIEQQQGEILRNRSLVGGHYNNLMASLVPEEDDWHPRDCSDQRTQQVVCPIDYASTTVRIQAFRGRAFVERVAAADVRALPPMRSESSSTLNERGAITKYSMCAERFSEKCEENICQVTGVACVPNGFENFETILVKFGGDTDSDVLRGSRVLCALPGPKGFSAVSGLPPSTDLSTVGFGQRSWVPVKDVNCLSWQCGHRSETVLRSLSLFGEHCTLDLRRDWLFLMHVIFFIWNLTPLPTRMTLSKTPHHSGQDSCGSSEKVAVK